VNNLKDIFGWMFVLILVYLLLAKPDTTNKVVEGLSSALTGTITALQGRDA